MSIGLNGNSYYSVSGTLCFSLFVCSKTIIPSNVNDALNNSKKIYSFEAISNNLKIPRQFFYLNDFGKFQEF